MTSRIWTGCRSPFLRTPIPASSGSGWTTDNSETDISEATASTYTLVADDQGMTIKVTVSFTDDAGYVETLTSEATAAVAAAANTPATGAPTITGTAQVGQTLTATVGDIVDMDGLPDPFLTDANTSFQWIRVDHRQQRDDHLRGDGEHLHAGGGRPGHDDQGNGELHRRRRLRRDADQRGDGGRHGGGEHPRDGRADDHGHGAGRADADGDGG